MSEVYQLAILLSLKDAASGGLNRVEAQLRSTGKEGRETLKTFQALRQDLQRGLTLAGTGVAGLAALRRGVKVAGDFEESILGIKSAFQEIEADGTVNLAKLGDQMNRAEKLGVDLGNKLQGTTRDYLEIFTALKQAGVDVETILNGAGRAAGYLANVTGTIRRGGHIEQAKELGQFGKMFKLMPEDFERSVNLFSALRDRFDIESGSLIESSKYFLATASSLDMQGMKGAEDSVKIFALLKRRAALEGTQAGTSLSSMFQQFLASPKDVDRLRKQGINLQLFDPKTKKFAGWENLFAQAEKLRALPEKTRLEFLNKIFGEQGAKAFNAFTDAGVAGWKEISGEAAKAVPVNDKINAQMELYNSKVEALQGSLENLVATTFTPLLDTLKPVVDRANEMTGAIQGFAKEHPTVTSVAAHLVGIGTAAVVVVAGFQAMRTGWRLWRLASAIGSHEADLLGWLRRTRTESQTTGDGLQGAGKKATGLKDRLGAVPSLVKTTITLVGIEYAIAKLLEIKSAHDDYKRALGEQHESAGQAYKLFKRLREAEQRGETTISPQQIKTEAASALAAVNMEGRLEFALHPERAKYGGLSFPWERRFGSLSPFKSRFFDTETAAGEFQQRAPELGDPAVMREFIAAFKRGALNLAPEAFEKVKAALEAGFPESFLQAQAEVEGLSSQSQGLSRDIVRLSQETQQAALSLDVFKGKLDSIEGLYPLLVDKPGVAVPSKAVGGDVERGGIVNVHAGETIVPARVTERFREGPRRGGDVHLHKGAVTINVPPGSQAAMDPRRLAQLVAVEVRRLKERS